MKGIILAGGTGSRLYPLTKVTNKHLLPVYDKPMIYYPLQTLIDAGLDEILILSGRGHAGHFLELLGSGSECDVRLTYEIQDEAGGIAQALGYHSKVITAGRGVNDYMPLHVFELLVDALNGCERAVKNPNL